MTPSQQIDLSSTISQSPQQISTSVNEEVMLLHIDRGAYYAMAETGSRIWSLIESPRRVEEVCDLLQSEFEVDRATCRRDVIAFLKQALAEELVQIHPDPPESG